MNQSLELKVFFFNAKTDYLAYYKSFDIEIEGSKRVQDLLEAVKVIESAFEYVKEKTALQINKTHILQNITIDEVVDNFGNTITIDPVSSYRSVKDLVINSDDFIQKFECVKAFCSEEDFEYYKTLFPYYYASETLKYNQDYLGDSFFIFADYLIEKYPDKKEAVINLIDDKESGIWLYEKECNIYPYEDKIKNNLIQSNKKEESKAAFFNEASNVLSKQFDVDSNDSQISLICDTIGADAVSSNLKHSFKDFNIAFYQGSKNCQNGEKKVDAVLKAIEANIVKFGSYRKANGYTLLNYNKEIAYKKAGNILLDAYDSGADILVVDSEEAFFMFDTNRKKCEQAAGRDIKLPILNLSQIVCLSQGLIEKKEIGLANHQVEPEFV